MVLHSVWDLSPTISVGDNPLYESSFVEHFGSDGKSPLIKKKLKSLNLKHISDVRQQVNNAILKHNLLTYKPPTLIRSYNNFCKSIENR